MNRRGFIGALAGLPFIGKVTKLFSPAASVVQATCEDAKMRFYGWPLQKQIIWSNEDKWISVLGPTPLDIQVFAKARRLSRRHRQIMNADCPACSVKRLHSEEDWKNHPLARHGFYSGQGWSSEAAKIAHELDAQKTNP